MRWLVELATQSFASGQKVLSKKRMQMYLAIKPVLQVFFLFARFMIVIGIP